MNRKGEAKEKHQCHHFLYFLDSKTCGPLSQGSAAVVVAELFAVHHKETHPWLYERARSFQYYVPYATHLCGCRLHIILIEINNVCFCIHLRKQKEKKIHILLKVHLSLSQILIVVIMHLEYIIFYRCRSEYY